jgi:4-carboxymuconolactone decarboxylase
MSEPRLTPLPAHEWGTAEYDAFGTLMGVPGDKVPRAGSGHRFDPLNHTVVGLLVHHPELAKAFFAFNSYQLQRNSLPIRWRELAILRVAAQRRSGYEWAQHVKITLDANALTETEIDQLGRGNDGFDGADLAVLDATDELLSHHRLGDESWAALHDLLTPHQVTDLIFIVGTYAMLAMAFDSWRLQPEPGMALLPDNQGEEALRRLIDEEPW